MPYRVNFTDKLYCALREIAEYITLDSPQNAEEVVEAALGLIASLDTMPGRFRRVGTSRKTGCPIHMTSTHSFNIYYQVDSERELVVILLIQRGMRKIPRRFD